MARTTGKEGFAMRSGNSTSFKKMGSTSHLKGFWDTVKKGVLGPAGMLLNQLGSGGGGNTPGASTVEGTVDPAELAAAQAKKAAAGGGGGTTSFGDGGSDEKLEAINEILTS